MEDAVSIGISSAAINLARQSRKEIRDVESDFELLYVLTFSYPVLLVDASLVFPNFPENYRYATEYKVNSTKYNLCRCIMADILKLRVLFPSVIYFTEYFNWKESGCTCLLSR